MKTLQYLAINKPYEMLSQFKTEFDKRTLAHLNLPIQQDVYPVGRLDFDSEGLLLLTNDSALNARLLNPQNKHQRTYWVQVEGAPTLSDFNKIKNGVTISIDKKPYKTLPCQIDFLSQECINKIQERAIPIRFRKNIPTTWLSITLVEGKNRQVRKMTAAMGFPTLRLIRYSIENLILNSFTPGTFTLFTKNEMYDLLHISIPNK